MWMETRGARSRRSRRARSFWARALVLGAVVSACGPGDLGRERRPLEGAELDAEDGATLYLTGRALPVGSPCTLRMRGRVFTAGERPRALSQELACQVLSERHARAHLSALQHDAQRPAVFEGELSLSFSDAQTHVLEAARLRLVDAARLAPAERLALARRASEIQEALGILEVESTQAGLKLTRLDPIGPAAQAGCQEGDLVRRADGAPVEQAADLAAASGPLPLRLELSRPGHEGPLHVRVSPETPSAPSETLAALLLGLGLIVGFLRPLALRAVSSASSARPPSLWSEAGLSFALLATSALVLGAWDVRVLWLLPVAARAAWLVRAHGQRRIAADAALGEWADLGTATLAVTALGVAQGSLRVALMDPGEQAFPWEFPLVTAPTLWLAVWVLARPSSAASDDVLARLTRDLVSAAKLCALATFALGAAHLPDVVTGGFALVLLGALVLVVKLGLAHALLTQLRAPASRVRRGLLALLAPVLGVASAHVFSSHGLAVQALGAAFAGLLVGSVVHQVSARLRDRPSVRDLAHAPFL